MPAYVGCGDDGGSSPNDSQNTGEEPTLSATEEKLSKCPSVDTTSDPTASACIEGTYEGKTLAGDDCRLTIGKIGAYTFSSPGLDVTSAPKGNSIFVFGHTTIGGMGLLTWKVSDPLSNESWDELDFSAQYGEATPAANRKLEIEVANHTGDTTTTVQCTLEF